jgi:hypothetical protein
MVPGFRSAAPWAIADRPYGANWKQRMIVVYIGGKVARLQSALRGEGSVADARSQGCAALHPGLFSTAPPGLAGNGGGIARSQGFAELHPGLLSIAPRGLSGNSCGIARSRGFAGLQPGLFSTAPLGLAGSSCGEGAVADARCRGFAGLHPGLLPIGSPGRPMRRFTDAGWVTGEYACRFEEVRFE